MPIVLPLAAVVLALFALLFMVAWAIWGNTIVNTLSIKLPVIGNVIGSTVAEVLQVTYAILVTWFDQLINPLVSVISAPIIGFINTLQSVFDAVNSLFYAAVNIANNIIPAAMNHAMSYALGLVNFVQAQLAAAATDLANRIATLAATSAAYALSLYNQAHGLIDYVQTTVTNLAIFLYNSAESDIKAAEAAVTAYAGQLYVQAISYALDRYNTAIAYAEGVAATAAADTVNALATAEAYADTTATHIAGVLITDAEQELVQAVNAIWPDVVTGVTAVEGVIGADLPDILQGLRAIPVGRALTWAESAAATAAVSIPMLKFMEQCGIPNCKNLSQLGRDLQALLGLVEDASFLAFLIELIRAPETAYRTVDDTFGAVLQDATTGARDLFGL